jgi:hypothetical protein
VTKRFLAFILLFSQCAQILAQSLVSEPPGLLNKNDSRKSRYNLFTGEVGDRPLTTDLGEYRAGYFPGAVMIPVQLWGAAKTTGLFHVPKNTTLTTLITFARGPTDDAELEQIKIKRVSESREKTFVVDVDKLLSDPNKSDIQLMPNDIVFIESKKAIVDPKWVYLVGFIASILAATAATVTIIDRRH